MTRAIGNRPTVQQLAYLVALDDVGHFGRAAAACFVSQPALSSQIKELERRLGTTLVERGARHVRLTEAGHRAAARARVLLAELDELVEEAALSGDEVVGTVVLGAIPTVAPYLLGSLVRVVTGRFPHVELRVEERTTAELLARLRERAIDLGLCALPVEGTDLHVEPLVDDPFLLAVPTGHPLADGPGPLPVDCLTGLRVLLLEDGHCLREQAMAVCDAAGLPRGSVADVGAASLATLVQLVAAGLGVTLLPATAAAVEARPGNGITARPFDAPAPSRTVVFVWRERSPRADAYLELARLVRPILWGLIASAPGRPAGGAA